MEQSTTAAMVRDLILEIQQLMGDISDYKLAQLLRCKPHEITNYLNQKTDVQGFKFSRLALLRYHSGLSWDKFGKLFDSIFLPKDPDDVR